MLKILIKKYFLLSLLMPQNIDHRAFSVRKTKMPNIEKKVQGISRIKYFTSINFLIDCQSNTFSLMNIIISDISNLGIKTSEESFSC